MVGARDVVDGIEDDVVLVVVGARDVVLGDKEDEVDAAS